MRTPSFTRVAPRTAHLRALARAHARSKPGKLRHGSGGRPSDGEHGGRQVRVERVGRRRGEGGGLGRGGVLTSTPARPTPNRAPRRFGGGRGSGPAGSW